MYIAASIKEVINNCLSLCYEWRHIGVSIRVTKSYDHLHWENTYLFYKFIYTGTYSGLII